MKNPIVQITIFIVLFIYLNFPFISETKEEEDFDDYEEFSNPSTDSWDDLYLCKTCNIEVITDLEEESED